MHLRPYEGGRVVCLGETWKGTQCGSRERGVTQWAETVRGSVSDGE
ncbi:UNVERIFIED_ORG: hypothetical protein GGD48_005578 [Rhizobium etli]